MPRRDFAWAPGMRWRHRRTEPMPDIYGRVPEMDESADRWRRLCSEAIPDDAEPDMGDPVTAAFVAMLAALATMHPPLTLWAASVRKEAT
jgi:hypothetical protein